MKCDDLGDYGSKVFGLLLVLFLLVVIAALGFNSWLEHQETIKAMESGYIQVFLPGSSRPVWVKPG